MQRILFVGINPNRDDHLAIIAKIIGKVEVYVINGIGNNSKKIINTQVFSWNEFISVNHIVKKLKPHSIVFFDIESYNEVLLNIYAKNQNISTYILDHGVRSFRNALEREEKETPNILPGSKVPLLEKVKNRLFILISLKFISKDDRLFFRKYIFLRKNHSSFGARRRLKDLRRLPSEYIVFSPSNLAYWQELDQFDKDQHKVSVIGFPAFDKIFKSQSTISKRVSALYVDSPFHEFNLFGWTYESKKEFVTQIILLFEELNIPLCIKLHPKSDEKLYTELKEDHTFQLVNGSSTEYLYLAEIIVGFDSSLLYPIISFSGTISFSINFHPKVLNRNLSQDFLDQGVSIAVNSFDELKQGLHNKNSILKSQEENKKAFIKKYLYKADGNSSNRLVEVLIK
ncbi:MAG: polysialyltransferase family glycosyltransferase [Ekhidna sp.]